MAMQPGNRFWTIIRTCHPRTLHFPAPSTTCLNCGSRAIITSGAPCVPTALRSGSARAMRLPGRSSSLGPGRFRSRSAIPSITGHTSSCRDTSEFASFWMKPAPSRSGTAQMRSWPNRNSQRREFSGNSGSRRSAPATIPVMTWLSIVRWRWPTPTAPSIRRSVPTRLSWFMTQRLSISGFGG